MDELTMAIGNDNWSSYFQLFQAKVQPDLPQVGLLQDLRNGRREWKATAGKEKPKNGRNPIECGAP